MGVAGYQYAGVLAHEVGDKRYELSNHLGNVLQVVRDAKLPLSIGAVEVLNDQFHANGNILNWHYDEDLSGIPVPVGYSLNATGGELIMQTGDNLGSVYKEVLLMNGVIYNLTYDITQMSGVVTTNFINENGFIGPFSYQYSTGSYNKTVVGTGDYYKIVFTGAENTTVKLDNIRFVANNQYAYLADVESFSDYYPYGMQLTGMHGTESSDGYRYGFQAQEKDDEVKGEGNSLNYSFRMHDPRIGRFFAIDPLEKDYPELTPYQFSSNSTIYMSEIEGLEGQVNVYNKTEGGNSKFDRSYIDQDLNQDINRIDNWDPTGHRTSVEIKTLEGTSIVNYGKLSHYNSSQINNLIKQTEYFSMSSNYHSSTNSSGSRHVFYTHKKGGISRAGVFSAEGEYKTGLFKTSGNISFIEGAVISPDASTNNYPTSLLYDYGAGVSALNAAVSASLGGENYSIGFGANGKALAAEARINSGIMTGQGGLYGVSRGGEIGAYALKGEVNPKFTVFNGLDVELTIGGSLVAAHAGGMGTIHYDTKAEKIVFKDVKHLGLGIGGKLGLGIGIPVSWFK